MSESNSNIDIEIGSERSFGIVFGIVFILIGAYPLFSGNGFRWWAGAIGIGFLITGFFMPRLLRVLNVGWFKFGKLLGAIIAPVIITIVYVISVVPVGLIMRMIGKDLLQEKRLEGVDSYWVDRDKPIGSMKNQF